MRVTFYTLGCKVNQNETGALAQLFEENGYTVVSNEEPADVYVVNSCTVTNFGDQKSRKWLRRAKRENPGAVTVLTGCYPQAFPEEAAEIKEADVVTGSGNRHAILADVTRVLNGEDERVVDIRPHRKGEKFEELPMDKFAEHTRAFVKVEDGCNRQCAYCVIPRARGPVRSRDEESILEELRRLAAAGYKEVVFSGINLSSYGRDTGTDLAEIVEKAAQVPGIPPQLEKIIMKATEKYQSNRYRTADEMIEDLDNIEFITKVISKITLVGALFLGLVATLPILLTAITGMNISLGGTSILIVVGVALDTVRQLESEMMMRHYKGFLE